MRFAHSPVPKRKPEAGGEATDGLHFCTVEEAVASFSARTAGKTLFLSDARSYPRLAFAATRPRALSVVLEGADALPLFAMPEGVGAVFAAGGEETLRAARFFAAVRGVPCALAPADGALYGVFPASGTVVLDGERLTAPLKEGEVYCDVAFLQPSLPDALARISLARLARFEVRALAVFGGELRPVAPAEPREITAESVVRANAALRRSEAEGAWQGEGTVLAQMYPMPDARRAARELAALYRAFFRCGKPRKYAVANYAARARQTGAAYGELHIPTPEEYARRALLLERRRADLARELDLVVRQNSSEIDSVYTFSQKAAVYRGVSAELFSLPERSTSGLSAIIRDFGLLERS